MAFTAPPPAPDFVRLDASEPEEKIINCIKEHGCVIIKDFVSPEVLTQTTKDVQPYLDADKPWKGATWPPETRRCTRLVQRSKTFREKILVHPLALKIAHTFADKTTYNYYNEQKYVHTSTAQIETTLTMEIGPGGDAQRLHRDDKNYHHEHTDRTQTGYKLDDDCCLGMLIAAVPSTPENGATWVIPGSHLWGDDRAPKFEETYSATLEPGDCVAFLGSVYHAGGKNTTKNEKRTIHSMFFTRGYYKQGENQYLITPTEDLLTYDPVVQELLGFGISSPVTGNVDFLTPLQFLSGDAENDFIGDIDPAQGKDIDNLRMKNRLHKAREVSATV